MTCIHFFWVEYRLVVNNKGSQYELTRTWACKAHFGLLSQVFFNVARGLFCRNISMKFQRDAKKIFLKKTLSIGLVWWKLKAICNFERAPGLLRPPSPVWGKIWTRLLNDGIKLGISSIYHCHRRRNHGNGHCYHSAIYMICMLYHLFILLCLVT